MKNFSAYFLALALLPGLALAAPDASSMPVRSDTQGIEVTPFGGHRYGGSFEDASTTARFELADTASFGLMLDFDSEPYKQIEVFLSRQDTQLSAAGTFTGNPLFDLTIDYYHIGGLYMVPEGEHVHPFVSGTIGLTRMAPHRSDLSTENRLSISLGAGAKYFISRNLGLRVDVRAIYTMMNSDTAVFCSGGCTIRINGNGYTQTEAGAALMLRF